MDKDAPILYNEDSQIEESMNKPQNLYGQAFVACFLEFVFGALHLPKVALEAAMVLIPSFRVDKARRTYLHLSLVKKWISTANQKYQPLCDFLMKSIQASQEGKDGWNTEKNLKNHW